VTRRVLVTGASGFVGRPTVAALAEKFDEIHAAARTPGDARGAQWHAVDLLEPGSAAALVDEVRPTHLVHLAWVAGPGYASSPDNERWVAASGELLDRFAAAGGRRGVVAGTCAEYDWSAPGPLREDARLGPASAYARAKDALRRDVEAVPGVSLAWARLFFLFGAGEHRGRLVPSVIDALKRGEKPALTPGRHRRDYLYVDDAARALAQLVTADVAGPVNVASGSAVAIRDLVTTIADAVNRPDLIEFGALPAPAEPGVVEADIGLLRGATGFEPRALEHGVAATVRSA
jgi:nucleoside-diphosphate-sugar epimerase